MCSSRAFILKSLFLILGYKFIVVTTAITNSARLLEALLEYQAWTFRDFCQHSGQSRVRGTFQRTFTAEYKWKWRLSVKTKALQLMLAFQRICVLFCNTVWLLSCRNTASRGSCLCIQIIQSVQKWAVNMFFFFNGCIMCLSFVTEVKHFRFNGCYPGNTREWGKNTPWMQDFTNSFLQFSVAKCTGRVGKHPHTQ